MGKARGNLTPRHSRGVELAMAGASDAGIWATLPTGRKNLSSQMTAP